MVVITPAQLHAAAPNCPDPEAWAASLNDAMLLWGIAANRDYVVEFLAQAAHESGQFTRLEESLNYTAERLVQVWPRRFPSLTVAVPYARNPHGLADLVYANRMGNGSPESGDGWNYRGRGIFMVTGRANYSMVAKLLNDPMIVTCPDRLRTRAIACSASAAWWAHNPELSRLALDEATDDDTQDTISISRIVNGGTQGIASRLTLRSAFEKAVS